MYPILARPWIFRTARRPDQFPLVTMGTRRGGMMLAPNSQRTPLSMRRNISCLSEKQSIERNATSGAARRRQPQRANSCARRFITCAKASMARGRRSRRLPSASRRHVVPACRCPRQVEAVRQGRVNPLPRIAAPPSVGPRGPRRSGLERRRRPCAAKAERRGRHGRWRNRHGRRRTAAVRARDPRPHARLLAPKARPAAGGRRAKPPTVGDEAPT
jgi:hypothetical protein